MPKEAFILHLIYLKLAKRTALSQEEQDPNAGNRRITKCKNQ